jgi:hypothetical protein
VYVQYKSNPVHVAPDGEKKKKKRKNQASNGYTLKRQYAENRALLKTLLVACMKAVEAPDMQ